MKTVYERAKLSPFGCALVEDACFAGEYELPILRLTRSIPTRAIPFDKARTAKEQNQWVHFYIHDYRFECLWAHPEKYLPLLRNFDGVISPDFSLYRCMPLAMQIWNTYRNRALAYWLQKNGVDVIPNVRWGDERTFAFCFDGIPMESTVAISTGGCIQKKSDRFYFKQGLQAMVERLRPRTIINYSCMPRDIFGPYLDAGMHIVQIPNYSITVREKEAL